MERGKNPRNSRELARNERDKVTHCSGFDKNGQGPFKNPDELLFGDLEEQISKKREE